MLVTYDGLLKGAAEIYAASTDMKDPLISVVTGFPPTILITGTRDLFLSDTARVHRKMRKQVLLLICMYLKACPTLNTSLYWTLQNLAKLFPKSPGSSISTLSN